MQKITPFMWFDEKAEEAANYYVSIFKNAKIVSVTHYGDFGAPKPRGTVMTVTFEIDGQQFVALNGGPDFPFTQAISFAVKCETQEEIDTLWEKLTADGGKAGQCGWLQDKYGASWQIVPAELDKWISDENSMRRDQTLKAVMGMVKLDIAEMRKAYESVPAW